MAQKQKRYILKGIVGDTSDSISSSFEKNLLRLSSIGIKYNSSAIRHMRGIGVNQQNDNINNSPLFGIDGNKLNNENLFLSSLAGQNDYIAFFDKSYEQRREFLRKFAMQGEIDFITDTIADDTIVYDENGYFAYPDVKQLAARLKPEKGKFIIDELNECFRQVYTKFKFNESHDAWAFFKKFLVEGTLAFEIIYDKDEKTNKATGIKTFQEMDTTTLEPGIINDNDGNEVKVWYQNKGDKNNERIIPESNLIYITWTKANHISRISYVERLVRSFNMLRTLENSRVIWNLQNAQKRLKFVIPIGTQNETKARMRLDMLKNEYKEDVLIDDLSGEVVVNGQPKFSFAKTFFFPSNDNGTTEISEIDVAGHDLSNTEQLKFFWQMFVLESKVPMSRFANIYGSSGDGSGEGIRGTDVISREEYTYNLFIKRCRNIYQELLIKPTWMQFCIKHPEFVTNELLKSLFGITYVEENLFTLDKERKIAEAGANTVTSLSSIQNVDGTPFFSIKFLCEKYLDLSEDDYKLNAKYLEEEKKNAAKNAEQNPNDMGGASGGFGGGPSFGGDDFGSDFGGGDDFGGDDFGGTEESEPMLGDSGISEPGDAFDGGELE